VVDDLRIASADTQQNQGKQLPKPKPACPPSPAYPLEAVFCELRGIVAGCQAQTSAQLRQVQAFCSEIATSLREQAEERPQALVITPLGVEGEEAQEAQDDFDWDLQHTPLGSDDHPAAFPAYIAEPKKPKTAKKKKPLPAKTAEQKQREKEQRERWAAPLSPDEAKKTCQEIYRDELVSRGKNPSRAYLQTPPRYLSEEMKSWPRRQVWQFIRAHRDAVLLQKRIDSGKPISRCDRCGTVVSQDAEHTCFIMGMGPESLVKGVPVRRATVAVTSGKGITVHERDIVVEGKLKENLNALAALNETRQVIQQLPLHGIALPVESAPAVEDEPMPEGTRTDAAVVQPVAQETPGSEGAPKDWVASENPIDLEASTAERDFQ
jgi:hypothetical protein